MKTIPIILLFPLLAVFTFSGEIRGQLVTQEVCLVTVEPSIQKNVIVWEKTPGFGIKWFVIWKETSPSVYDSIAYVFYDSLSIYTDYSSDANLKSDRYYITAEDSAGNQSLPGTPHKTIHFSVQLDSAGMPSLSWENYEGFWYPRYRIWRGTSPGNVYVFDSVGWSTTTYTDTLQGDTLYYLGEVVRSVPCSATVKLKTYNSSKSNTAALANPSLVLTVSTAATNVTCYNGSDGTGTATVTGGTPAFSYQWSDPQMQTTSSATGLSAGTYFITITDAAGDAVSDTVIITEPPSIIITTSSSDATCSNADGSATATATGGGGGFSYLWSNSQTGVTSNGLSAGNYQITVTDASGCTQPGSVTVNSVNVSFPVSTTTTSVSCYGGNDGTATAIPSGGISPYTYQWEPAAGNQTTSGATGLNTGSFAVTVTDSAGCFTLVNSTVTEPPPLTLTALITDANVPGNNDGSVDITVAGGTPSYTYFWSTGAVTEDLDSLPSGTYSVTITDANNCQLIVDTLNVNLMVTTGNSEAADEIILYPNPCSGSTTIEFLLPAANEITVIEITGLPQTTGVLVFSTKSFGIRIFLDRTRYQLSTDLISPFQNIPYLCRLLGCFKSHNNLIS
ncbi:MAG: SprB repeat-containing protein [Bacteroidetes bacterium]|nr:SprB repeat-containing protein [Bacteroidota bacterium]